MEKGYEVGGGQQDYQLRLSGPVFYKQQRTSPALTIHVGFPSQRERIHRLIPDCLADGLQFLFTWETLGGAVTLIKLKSKKWFCLTRGALRLRHTHMCVVDTHRHIVAPAVLVLEHVLTVLSSIVKQRATKPSHKSLLLLVS